MYAEQLETRPTIFRSCAPDDMLAAVGSTLATSCTHDIHALAPVLLSSVVHTNDESAVNLPPRAPSGEPTSAGFAWLLAEASAYGDAAECGWSRE
jgi:hypothetical protein